MQVPVLKFLFACIRYPPCEKAAENCICRWNEKDYSHEGFGKILKKLNGDHLTKITQPPESL